MAYLELWFRAIVEPAITWIGSLPTELRASLADPGVWAAFAIALILGAVAGLFGIWLARRVGLFDPSASIGETVGVGLGLGLVVLAAWWAALASRGQSSFTPIAIAFAVAVLLAAGRPRRSSLDESDPPEGASTEPRAWVKALGLMGVFVVLIGLVYGSTMSPSPRDGVQPLEFSDEAYYSVLAANLAETGLETPYAPSGFESIPGTPRQSWYHWGEIWLASGVITLAGIEPMLARHYVVLPLILLVVAALTGSVVMRLTGSRSRRTFLVSAAAGILLAPMPLIIGDFFGSWARGAIFGVTQYGVAVIIGLLALYAFGTQGKRPPSVAWAILVGSLGASLVAAHVGVAIVAFGGAVGLWSLHSVGSLIRARRLPPVPVAWRGVVVSAGVVGAVTVGWGLLTGHGFAGSAASPTLGRFGGTWPSSVVATLIGGGVFLAIPLAWWARRRDPSPLMWSLQFATASAIVGCLLWGALLADFNTFHFFFGTIVVFGTPVAVAAVWTVVRHLRNVGRRPLAATILVLFGIQLSLGTVAGVQRLEFFGSNAEHGTPTALLDVIRGLPPAAKLAYSCGPQEEVAAWLPALASIEAHTGRHVVPLCFQSDVLSHLNGGDTTDETESPLFTLAPQRELFPGPDAHPSEAAVVAFLKKHRINYLYVDAAHPNTLVPHATQVAASGSAQILQIP